MKKNAPREPKLILKRHTVKSLVATEVLRDVAGGLTYACETVTFPKSLRIQDTCG